MKTKTRNQLFLLYAALIVLAAAISAQAQTCDLRFQASLGGCDSLFTSWFTTRNDVISQTLRYSDGFSPAIASSVRSYSRQGVGCGAHFGVNISQRYGNGQECAAYLSDNHNRGCDQCGAQIAPLSVVSAASFRTYSTENSLLAAFGQGITTVTMSANVRPFPLNLGGVQVWIDEQPAGISFVSPNQINFHAPSGLQAGLRTVRATNAEGKAFFGDIFIQAQGPAVFTRDGTGTGVAAADWYPNGLASFWLTGINPALFNVSNVVLVAGGIRYPAQFVEKLPSQYTGMFQVNITGLPYNGQGAFFEIAGYQSQGFTILKR